LDKPTGIKGFNKNGILLVSSGKTHTAIIDENQNVFVMGSNLHEKLGIDLVNVINKSRPTPLPLAQMEKLQQVVCGDYHTLALTEKGQIWGWGGTWHKKQVSKTQKPMQLRIHTKVNFVQIGCGDFHSMALSDTGVLYSWGGGGRDFNKG
jgi:alpha-tubulin suppressor-like RCC1 family protein